MGDAVIEPDVSVHWPSTVAVGGGLPVPRLELGRADDAEEDIVEEKRCSGVILQVWGSWRRSTGGGVVGQCGHSGARGAMSEARRASTSSLGGRGAVPEARRADAGSLGARRRCRWVGGGGVGGWRCRRHRWLGSSGGHRGRGEGGRGVACGHYNKKEYLESKKSIANTKFLS